MPRTEAKPYDEHHTPPLNELVELRKDELTPKPFGCWGCRNTSFQCLGPAPHGLAGQMRYRCAKCWQEINDHDPILRVIP